MAFNLSCLRFATLPWAPVPTASSCCCCRSRACVWPSIEAASAPPLSAIGLLIVVSPRCCWGDFLT
ncbi:unnamed protein product [Staurois parvus]|uniref:Secreted protein n=1 Tax=Staurois parvus TaxID=386267 RepID=A0ABN9BUG2_9NEOB|nr:unnamed protein product [Staurois parvus]